jgi:hypothetical protein
MSWEAAVYLLCLATSVVCALLLVRSYARTRQMLLLWSSFCFCLLALNNAVVVLDMVVWPVEQDLTAYREATSLAAVCVLLYGFIWRSE